VKNNGHFEECLKNINAMKLSLTTIFVLLFLIFSCKNSTSTDTQTLPVFAEKGINMVVEIPAGTNHKIEINKATGAFENDKIDGKTRIINFLPYPGNYGFIPSTLMDEARGGDGDALDILMIGESVETGTVVQIKPIGVLLLKDNGELDTKLIAIPADSSKVVMQAYNFTQFSVQHTAAKKMIEDWFLNYKGPGEMEFLGWRDEVYALEEIRKWQK
jgi:inorganic pyrophosphatase